MTSTIPRSGTAAAEAYGAPDVPTPALPEQSDHATDLVQRFMERIGASRGDAFALPDDANDPAAVGRLILDAYRDSHPRSPTVVDPIPIAASLERVSGEAVDPAAPIVLFGSLPRFPMPAPATALAPVAVPEVGGVSWPFLSAPAPVAVPSIDVITGPHPPVLPRGRRRHAAPRTGLRDDHRRWLITASTWVRNIGALLILFAAWQVWGTAIAQHHTQAALRSQFDAKVATAPHPAKTFTLAPATAQLPEPPGGTDMALIQVPEIGIDQVVVSGTDADDLAKGPGHYIGTAMPGQAGNVAIAGHRTTHGAPFNRLAELAPGDPIYLTTPTGQRLTYIVAQTPYPVLPSNTSVLNDFGDNRLTLTTCNPEFSAAQRLIVVAEYQPPGATPKARPVVAKGSGTPVNVTASGEAGWNTPLIPLVLLELGLLVALGLLNGRLARFFGREGRWLVLVPIWLALLFALFQSLTSFLPAAA